jgi:SAM-dependent methyltransferase
MSRLLDPSAEYPVTDFFLDRSGLKSLGGGSRRIQLRDYLLDNEDVAQSIGLPVFEVPERIHFVGARRNVGDFLSADILASPCLHHDVSVDGEAILDFGCSSGRLARTLAHYFSRSAIHGCDPREDSIAWAKENFSGVHFFRSNEEPPLPDVELGAFKVVVSISVWSHFSPARSLEWLAEIRRAVKLGGVLVMTVGGIAKVREFAKRGRISADECEKRFNRLLSGQYLFSPYGQNSGQARELDVENWGSATVDKVWYESHVHEGWELLGFYPGCFMNTQDIYILRAI